MKQCKISLKYIISEQHKESTCARQECNLADAQKFIRFMKDRSPFDDGANLHNIATGVVASSSVNAEHAQQIGSGIIASMVDKNV